MLVTIVSKVQRCSGIKSKLKDGPTFKCKRCIGLCRPIDGTPETFFILDESKLDVMQSFCYLMMSYVQAEAGELVAVARMGAA